MSSRGLALVGFVSNGPVARTSSNSLDPSPSACDRRASPPPTALGCPTAVVRLKSNTRVLSKLISLVQSRVSPDSDHRFR